MSAFTPGPWKVKESESKEAFNVIGTKLGGKYKIARCPYTVYPGQSNNSLQSEKIEAKANAKLAAKSPEMYDLLNAYATAAEMGLITDLKKMGRQFREIINEINSI